MGSHQVNPVDNPRAGRREWIGLAVIALPCLLYSMDLTVLNLAVPHLSADLRPSSAQLAAAFGVASVVAAFSGAPSGRCSAGFRLPRLKPLGTLLAVPSRQRRLYPTIFRSSCSAQPARPSLRHSR
jgi:MFS family permease